MWANHKSSSPLRPIQVSESGSSPGGTSSPWGKVFWNVCVSVCVAVHVIVRICVCVCVELRVWWAGCKPAPAPSAAGCSVGWREPPCCQRWACTWASGWGCSCSWKSSTALSPAPPPRGCSRRRRRLQRRRCPPGGRSSRTAAPWRWPGRRRRGCSAAG